MNERKFTVTIGGKEEILFTEAEGKTTFVCLNGSMISGVVKETLCMEVGKPLHLTVYKDRAQICSDSLSEQQETEHTLFTRDVVTCIALNQD